MAASRVLSIGREADNDVVVDAVQVSRYHARVHVQGSQLTIEDLGTSNGTKVNGVLVKRAAFTLGDRIQFGSYTLDTSRLARFLPGAAAPPVILQRPAPAPSVPRPAERPAPAPNVAVMAPPEHRSRVGIAIAVAAVVISVGIGLTYVVYLQGSRPASRMQFVLGSELPMPARQPSGVVFEAGPSVSVARPSVSPPAEPSAPSVIEPSSEAPRVGVRGVVSDSRSMVKDTGTVLKMGREMYKDPTRAIDMVKSGEAEKAVDNLGKSAERMQGHMDRGAAAAQRTGERLRGLVPRR
jgi:hypothetical protein